MNFSGVELLSLSQTSELLGNTLALRTIQNIGIKARLTNTQTDITVAPIWSGIDQLTNITGYEPVILNGVLFGTGRMVSLTFDEGTDTRFKTYRAEIQVVKDADSYNVLSGVFFQDISGYAKPYFPFLTTIQENSSFNQVNSGIYDINRDISIEVDSFYSGDAKSLAKTIASGLIYNYPFLNLIGLTVGDPYLNSGQGLYYNTESYDNINQRYSFSQNISTTPSGFYTWKYTHSLNYDVDGTVSVSENGNIISTKIVSGDKYTSASNGWLSVSTGIYNRVSDTCSGYFKNTSGQLYFSGNVFISPQPVESSLTKNIYAGTIDYNYSYSNNPALYSGYSYSYEDEISVNENGYLTVSENGQLQGFLKNNTGNYNNIKNVWLSSKSGIEPRIQSYLNSYSSGEECSNFNSGILTQSQETYSEYNSNISYSYTYSTDINNQPSGDFYKITVSRSDTAPVHSAVTYSIAHFDEIVQSTKQSTRGSFTNKVDIISKTGVTMDDMLDAAFARVIKPNGSDIYVNEFTYSYSPQANSLSFQLGYSYSNYKEMGEYLL
jgi:hypothetical protein